MSKTTTAAELARDVRDTDTYGRLTRIVKAVEAAVNPERHQREADVLHTGRLSRNMHKHTLTPTLVWEATTKDMQARSRMVEIRVSVTAQRDVLRAAVKGVRRYVTVENSESLKRLASTAEERKALVDRIVGRAVTLVEELDELCERLDMYITDIDKSSYGLRVSTDLLKLIMQRNGAE